MTTTRDTELKRLAGDVAKCALRTAEVHKQIVADAGRAGHPHPTLASPTNLGYVEATLRLSANTLEAITWAD